MVIGAILTQSAAWTNVEKALQNLKDADCWSLESIDRCSQEELASIIRPSGYFNAKARKLKAFAHHVCHHYGGHLEAFFNQETVELRAELLSIHGIGPETADDILVYAAGKTLLCHRCLYQENHGSDGPDTSDGVRQKGQL